MKIHSRLPAAAAFFAALAMPALAAPISLTLQNPGSISYQQTQNNPCVVGDPSCNNPAGFGETVIPANTANYDLSSPTYTVGQITGIVGPTFSVGIDVNTTTSPLATEQLVFFKAFVGGTLAFQYAPSTPTTLFTVANGNGRSDELITGFDLSPYTAGTLVSFEVSLQNATDGREEFFLVSSTVPTPEPASIALLGAGLCAVTFLRKKKSVV